MVLLYKKDKDIETKDENRKKEETEKSDKNYVYIRIKYIKS